MIVVDINSWAQLTPTRLANPDAIIRLTLPNVIHVFYPDGSRQFQPV